MIASVSYLCILFTFTAVHLKFFLYFYNTFLKKRFELLYDNYIFCSSILKLTLVETLFSNMGRKYLQLHLLFKTMSFERLFY